MHGLVKLFLTVSGSSKSRSASWLEFDVICRAMDGGSLEVLRTGRASLPFDSVRYRVRTAYCHKASEIKL